MRPNFPMIRAATPETTGAALLGVRRRFADGGGEMRQAGALPREDRAEAQIDDVGAGPPLADWGRSVDDPPDDPREETAAAVQHLHADDRGVRRDPYRTDVLARRRGDAGHVRCVPDGVGSVAGAGRAPNGQVKVERLTWHE